MCTDRKWRTSIGEKAFSGCSNLTSIDIPESVRSIGYHAFENCSSLTSISIPEGVTSIELAAFWGCSSLTDIRIPESVTSIGAYAFSGCSSLTNISIPESVTSIEGNTFSGCSSLTSISIPESVKSIENSAFENCNSLTSITIPEGVTSIELAAFWGCSSLISISIPESVISIKNGAFYNCSSLTSISIPQNVRSIGDYAFSGCSSLTSINIPEGVTSIGYDTFRCCNNLASIRIPESVTNIGEYAFYDCSSLTSINIPEGVTNIGEYAFYDCSSLTSINIPEGVTSIGRSVFYGCSSLTSINIPEGVTNIGEYAFYDCSSLTSINIPESVTSIGDATFQWCLDDLTIYGILGSYAEIYANNKGISFVAIPEYTVIFDANGGTDLSFESINRYEYEKLGDMPTVQRKGYTFKGWFTSAEEGIKVTEEMSVTANITIYAQWEENIYTITYQLNGGKNHASNKSNYSVTNETITLAKPSKTGYVFEGWYIDVDYQNEIKTIPKGSTGDLVIYAKWRVSEYQIVYAGNGATSGTMITTSHKYGTTYNLKENTFKKTGYTFTGWNTKEDGSGTKYSNKQTIKSLSSVDGKKITLYAQWQKIKYTITYELNGGKNNTSNPASYYVTTSTITLKAPTRTGYDFGGWYSDAKFKNKVTKISKGSTGNKTYYAKWIPHTYKILYNGNGNTSGTMSAITYKYGTTYNLKENAFKKKGYTFTGWNTKADGSGIKYNNKQSIKSLSSVDGKKITLYAQWKKTKYTITYKLNGGKNSSKNPASYYVTTSTITLKAPTRTGYDFGGWYSDAKFKNKVSKISKGSTGNKTYYAKWIPHTYKILYNGNGNTSGTMSVTSHKYGTTYGIKENVFKRTGYTFTGWNTKADGSGTSYANKASVKNLTSVDGKTITLYAQWSRNTYYVKFNANDPLVEGSMSKITCKYGKSYKLPSCGFKHEKYVFTGWNTKKDGTGKSYTNGASIKNLTSVNKKTITLYATWGVERPSISEVQKDSYSSQEIHIKTVDSAEGYEIYRSTSSKGKYKKVGTTAYSTFIDSNLKEKTKYYYKIRAYTTNSKGDKIYSDYSKVVTGVTAKKPNFSAYVDANFGDYVSIVYLHIDNKGDERFIVGGSSITNFCNYYPYEDASYTKGTLVDRNFRECIGIYTEGGESGYCMFVLERERFTTQDASLACYFIYDECGYILSVDAYGNGMFSSTGEYIPEEW